MAEAAMAASAAKINENRHGGVIGWRLASSHQSGKRQ
jgi:hypothetical protein